MFFQDELRSLSAEMVKLSMAGHRFERLEVDASLALKMFADNQYKKRQVPFIAAQSSSGNFYNFMPWHSCWKQIDD